MKTKLHSMPDWRQTLMELGLNGALSDADVEDAVLRELSRGRITFQAADIPIEAGCRVTIRTASTLSRYNREKTVLVVGSGLFDPVIEEKLLGMKKGERGEAVIRGERVEFTVTQVERKVFPELSDALVREQKIEGVETLAQYRQYMAVKLRQGFVKQLCDRLLERLSASSVTDEPDHEDVCMVIDRQFEPLRERFSHGGDDLDTMTPEQWKANFYHPELKAYYEQIYPDVALLFDTTSKESFYEKRSAEAGRTIRDCLILRTILEDYSTAHDPTLALDAEPELRRAMEARIDGEVFEKG